MNRGVKIFLAVFFSVLAVLLTIILVLLLSGRIKGFKLIKAKLIDSKEYEIVERIKLEIDNGDIKIKESNSNNIKIEFYSNNLNNYEVRLEDNVLKASLSNKKKNFINRIFSFGTSKIVIYLPSDYTGQVTTKNSVGDIKVENFKNLDFNCKLGVGDLRIDTVNNSNITLDVGDLRINNVNVINADVKTGDVRIENINESLNIKTKTGDIRLKNVNILSDSYIDLAIGDVRINNINNVYVDASNKVGDIKVNNNSRMSEHVLTIKANIGEIKVN